MEGSAVAVVVTAVVVDRAVGLVCLRVRVEAAGGGGGGGGLEASLCANAHPHITAATKRAV